MKTNSSILMATLTLTAIVLGVILLATPNRQAQAAMVSNEPGLTMMTTGVVGADEQLVIIDKTSGKMLIYHLGVNGFELTGNSDINTLFATGAR